MQCPLLSISPSLLLFRFVSKDMSQMVDQPLDAFIQSKKRGRGGRGRSRGSGFRGGNRRGGGGAGKLFRGGRMSGRGIRRGGRLNRVRVYSISCNL